MGSNQTNTGPKPAAPAPQDELVVALPPEILAMMAASEAAMADTDETGEPEPADLAPPETAEPSAESAENAANESEADEIEAVESENKIVSLEPATLELGEAEALEDEPNAAAEIEPLAMADMAEDSGSDDETADETLAASAASAENAEPETGDEPEAGDEPATAGDALPDFVLAMMAEASAPVEGEVVCALPAVLDITAASGLHGTLLAHRGAPLALDASAVKRLGGQCLQLLISAGRTWGADGVPIRLSDSSEAFQRDLALMGLSCDELFEREAA
ncbi:STAS domain-containing protein [Aureimonas sp. D3]|uniref:STAS domain-containing protein n=1 Tax=Aureimonas sp. D3 TaxID=1638164 RepID=UPI000AEEAF49|nr:STAS domain-containing protein [Aureimonas sp. D3]